MARSLAAQPPVQGYGTERILALRSSLPIPMVSGTEHDVFGFEVAMDDARRVGGGQAFGDLGAEVDGFPEGNRTAVGEVAEGFAFHQFGDDVGDAVLVADIVDRDDIGVGECAGDAGFLFEAAAPVGVEGAFGGAPSRLTTSKGPRRAPGLRDICR